jgi:hypothetical protein
MRPKGLRFRLEAARDAVCVPLGHGFDRRERRRVGTARLLEHLLPGLAKHHGAPHRIVLEQQLGGTGLSFHAGALSIGELVRPLDGHGAQNGRMHQIVHQPERTRLARPNGLAGEDEVERGLQPDQAR